MALILLTLLTILTCLFAIYTLMEWHASRSSSPSAKTRSGSATAMESWPDVSVLLPVYNEKMVVRKLLEAVSRLDYPPSSLEILVLDDSTDECSEVLATTVKAIREQGVNMRYLRRKNRIGFKAGNLAFGLEYANGEFIAIFDADCRPCPSFLKKTVPYFANPRLGFLQTGIEYDNAQNSLLTRFQAMEASHKDDVTSGLSENSYMASLTGSACVWRRACINAIGGISAETITEDVDMGYAAQLDNWRCLYLSKALACAELPETMASFRVQRQRWARGLVHNAFRHAGRIFATPMTILGKLHALSLVFSPLLLALFYLLLILAPFIALATPQLGIFFHAVCLTFLISAIFWGWINTSPSGTQSPKAGLLRQLADAARYILLFFPLSLYYMSAIIQLAMGGGRKFHKTPKGCGRQKVPHPPINKALLLLEALSLLYALLAMLLAITHANYWVLLYAGLCAGGFAMSLLFSFQDLRKGRWSPEHILITGASGSIGQALAREYAREGAHLTLQGRNREKLHKLSEECSAKGATCSIVQLDLRDAEKVRLWGEQLALSNPPDLLIANAGLNANIGPDARGESWQETKDLVQVNVLATFALVDAILPAMRKRKAGQIAIMSSLAAYYGLPHTPSYCATKAALRNWGMAMRGWLHHEGIRVNVVLPGYVDSPMCRAMPGPKPFLWTPERAARLIRKGLVRNRARISFPFPLNLGIWGLSLLPACLAMPIAKLLGYGR